MISGEIITTIVSAIIAISAAIKSIADARKARYEAAAREEAEKATEAVIKGVERAKKTLGQASLVGLLAAEIKSEAEAAGVEEGLNQRVKKIRGTLSYDKEKLKEKLGE